VFALLVVVDPSPWKIFALIVAALFAVAIGAIAVRRARLEGRVDAVTHGRRLLVPPEAVSSIDPGDIGIPQAAPTVLGDNFSEYVDREIDRRLLDAVQQGCTGDHPWIVVVVGDSAVGKSRTLFEALTRCLFAGAPLKLVAPANGDALKELLIPGQEVVTRDEPAVLWLDDLEPFLAKGITYQTLREWRASGQCRIVAATYGGKGSEQSTVGLQSIADTILQRAIEIHLASTSEAELFPLRERIPEEEWSAVREYGLAECLVAAPRLVRKLRTAQHPGDSNKCREGVAVVDAAIDWARCGRADPISEDVLQQLWRAYRAPDIGENAEGFATGFEMGAATRSLPDRRPASNP
jgi:hypothetical protein